MVAAIRHRSSFLATGVVELLLLECFNVLKAVDNAAAYFQITRPLVQPAPALKRARAELPAAGKFDLIEMAYQMR